MSSEQQAVSSERTAIDAAVAEVTGVSVDAPMGTVWIYGRAEWCHAGRMEFMPEPQRPGVGQPKGFRPRVTIMTSLVRRYRDGDSDCFLVEMPRHMATVLDIENCVLDDERLALKRSVIDTSTVF